MSDLKIIKRIFFNPIEGEFIDILPVKVCILHYKAKGEIGWCLESNFEKYTEDEVDLLSVCFDSEFKDTIVFYNEKFGYPVKNTHLNLDIKSLQIKNQGENIKKSEGIKKARSEKKWGPTNPVGYCAPGFSKKLWEDQKEMMTEVASINGKKVSDWNLKNLTPERRKEIAINAGKKGGKKGKYYLLEKNLNSEVQKQRSIKSHSKVEVCPTCGNEYIGVNRKRHFKSCKMSHDFNFDVNIYEYLGFRFINIQEMIRDGKIKYKLIRGNDTNFGRMTKIAFSRVKSLEIPIFYGSGMIGSYTNRDFIICIINYFFKDERDILNKSEISEKIIKILNIIKCNMSFPGVRRILREIEHLVEIDMSDGRKKKRGPIYANVKKEERIQRRRILIKKILSDGRLRTSSEITSLVNSNLIDLGFHSEILVEGKKGPNQDRTICRDLSFLAFNNKDIFSVRNSSKILYGMRLSSE